MNPDTAFRYCPLCASRLQLEDEHGTRRPTCPSCGFIYYRNPVPAAGVLLVERGQVLFVKRRFDPRAGAWCLPAGFMEYGETPRHCAVRELAEETGLDGGLKGLVGVYAGLDDPRVRSILVIYEARRAGGRLVPGDDAIEARFFPLGRPPRDIAFEAHRQALREYGVLLRRRAAADRPARATAGPPSRATARGATAARRPRPTRAARPRSRRA